MKLAGSLIGSIMIFALPLWSMAAQTAPSTTVPAAPSLPDGPGKAIVQRACVACHNIDVVTSKRANPQQWDQLVNQMVSRGADMSDEEIDVVIQYLSSHYGPLDQTNGASLPSPAAPPAPTPAEGVPAPGASPAPINVNEATAHDLEVSLGLSEAESEAVVRYRDKNGKFKSWRDVAAVPGVTFDTIEALRNRLTF